MSPVRHLSLISRSRVALAVGLAAALFAFAPSTASAAGSAYEGHKLAERWCTGCHQIAPGQPTNDVAPSFQSLAREKDGDFEWARLWLFDPHPPMEGIALSRQEIEDVVAYFKTLVPDEPPPSESQ